MRLPSVNPTTTQAWKKLQEHFEQIKTLRIRQQFTDDPQRAEKFSIHFEDFYLDFSKNRITEESISLLIQLAEEVQLKEAIQQQFSGEKINVTEDRAVLHTALRDLSAMKPEIKGALKQMKAFSEKIIRGTHMGYSGKAITHIVNVGIGGSNLGPAMVMEAMSHYRNHLNVLFISNVDGDHLTQTLATLDPETTLFIVVSKSFSTQETLTNAKIIKKWFLKQGSERDIAKHFVAVSQNEAAAIKFGIHAENIFPVWDWVGGRFSLWSAVGLSVCCGLGYSNFESLLKGAHTMDSHFRSADFSENLPVILALLSVWYNNFFNAESEAVIPYSQYLTEFVPYLQQAAMESNGKQTDRNGKKVDYQTGTIVWGSTGTNAQHAFFQLLHQGTKFIPTDFILFAESLYNDPVNQQKLVANCFAQTEALMQGTQDKNIKGYKEFEGNKPSNTLLIKKLTPESLGGLVALYEHKIFVQGVVWNIFSFDQWGVELGKKIAKNTLKAIENKEINMVNSPSTKKLMSKWLDMR
ncbi:glucose-6-phosphate isomerase [Constantimarinum furrinae]|uniref:Glucose-6-phosphate isomerase n=1 Tax=Constantimarinum furrinae TaxID=2562285 RepID=A0A7G8PXG4_9FLAO|nr:glucose-6-phosphate isomerase [Constantimarinum furrinae]QNJ99030.1 Glucose-6-phosphate isomerase [Constantimarinum furrinae]